MNRYLRFKYSQFLILNQSFNKFIKTFFPLYSEKKIGATFIIPTQCHIERIFECFNGTSLIEPR